MNNTTILLTGATGFVGSHLLKYLVSGGYAVIVLKRTSSDLSRIEGYLDRIWMYDADRQGIEMAFQAHRIDVVMHLASSYGRDRRYKNLIESNILFGVGLVEMAIAHGVSLFINTDTFFNSNSPQSYLAEYTLSKRHFLEVLSLRRDEIKVANLKLHHVYGENDSPEKFSTWLYRELAAGVKSIKLTWGTQLRDFVYIDDVVRAYEIVMLANEMYDSMTNFNVCTGKKHTVRRFSELMAAEILGDEWKAKKSLKFGAKPTNPDELRDVDNDNRRLVEIGWLPRFELAEGLRAMAIKSISKSR